MKKGIIYTIYYLANLNCLSALHKKDLNHLTRFHSSHKKSLKYIVVQMSPLSCTFRSHRIFFHYKINGIEFHNDIKYPLITRKNIHLDQYTYTTLLYSIFVIKLSVIYHQRELIIISCHKFVPVCIERTPRWHQVT